MRLKKYCLLATRCVITLWILLSFSSRLAYAVNVTTSLKNNRLDIGRVDEGEILTQNFFVTNNSGSPVKISIEALGCDCLDVVAPRGKVELVPSQKQEVIFNLDTAGFSGKISKPLYIYTTDKISSVIKIEVSADVRADREIFIRRFTDFNFLTISTLGLVDGVNPCAFTVMVFFVSFLTFVGYKKKDMAIVGGVFIFAVCLTYTLIGIGLFKALRGLDVFTDFSRIFYRAIAGFAFILGLINLYDFWIYKRTQDADRIIIKLPSSVKKKIQGIIREGLIKEKKDSKTLFVLIAASLSCGFLVSILELFCTGQLYLPTITYVLKIPDLRLQAIYYLLLYNVMFILPLVAIFILAFSGFTSSRFEQIARMHLSNVKLVTAFVFFGLGIIMLITRT